MPEPFKKSFHVTFTTEQRAALGLQLADVHEQHARAIAAKRDAMKTHTDRISALAMRSDELALAVREGEGDVEVMCQWRPRRGTPFEDLWRLDTVEVMETRPMAAGAKKKTQLDLLTPSPDAGPNGKTTPAGAEPGEKPPGGDLIKVSFAPRPPCPAPVEGGPGGICGEDGADDCEGFCAKHHGELEADARRAILDAIWERRRQQRIVEATERTRRQMADAIATPEDEARARRAKAVIEIGRLACAACGVEPATLGGDAGVSGLVERVLANDTAEINEALVRVIREASGPFAAQLDGKPADVPANALAAPGVHIAAEPLDGAQRCQRCNGVLLNPSEDGAALFFATGATVKVDDSGTGEIDEEAPTCTPADAREADAAQPGSDAAPWFTRFRDDGAPVCPNCQQDRLAFGSTTPRAEYVVKCEACGWHPPADPAHACQSCGAGPGAEHWAACEDFGSRVPTIADQDRRDVRIRKPKPGEVRRATLVINGHTFTVSDIAAGGNWEALAKSGPCAHRDDLEGCVKCTEAAISSARAQLPAAGNVTADAPSSGECEKVRRVLTPAEVEAREAKCGACGKAVKVRPVEENSGHVATLAKHKPLVDRHVD